MKPKNPSFDENDGAAHSLNSDMGSTRDPYLDIKEQIDQLEVIIFESFKIPLTSLVVVNEEKLLKQLDEVKRKIPQQIEQAIDVLLRKKMIIAEAEDCAQRIIDSAQKRANQILNESGIIQQAEMEARELRHSVHLECDSLQRHTLEEVEKMRTNTVQQVNHMIHSAQQQSDSMYRGADEYVDSVLNHLEQELHEMLKVVERGRRQRDSNH